MNHTEHNIKCRPYEYRHRPPGVRVKGHPKKQLMWIFAPRRQVDAINTPTRFGVVLGLLLQEKDSNRDERKRMRKNKMRTVRVKAVSVRTIRLITILI